MLLKRNFSFFKVLSYIWQEILYAGLVVGLAYLLIVVRLVVTFTETLGDANLPIKLEPKDGILF
jgi:hypothetical protein